VRRAHDVMANDDVVRLAADTPSRRRPPLFQPVRYGTLSLLVILTACQVGKADRMPSSSSSDTVSGRAPENGDATAPPQVAAAPSGADTRDSGDVFDPDGYYSPVDTLAIDGRELEWIELHTVDYYYGGELHYDRPHLLQPPVVTISISNPDREKEPDSEKERPHPCTASRITPDSLSVRCAATSMGDVNIEGHFLGGREMYFNKFAEMTIELLEARVIISRSGKIVHDAVHRFTFYAGD
jgi:hypothetical protein